MPANMTLKPRDLVLTIAASALGGFVGTMARDLLVGLTHLPAPSQHGVSWLQEIPWVLLVINFVGVYLATRLLSGSLRHHDPNNVTRVLVITGFFGGLTSYSGLFVDLAAIWHVSTGGCFAGGGRAPSSAAF